MYCELVYFSEIILNKTCYELNPSSSVIPDVIHKLINYYYVRYKMYTHVLKKSWLFVYVFITQLGKITINVRNHQNIAFHS